MIIKVVGIENYDYVKDGNRIIGKKVHYARIDHGLDNVIGGIPGSFSVGPKSEFFSYPLELGGEYIVFTDQDARFKDKRVICHISQV